MDSIQAEPAVTASALLMNKEGRFLLGLRAPWKATWPGHWDVIGGHVEAEETAEVAMIREVREEAGVVPIGFRWLTCLPEPRIDLYGEYAHHIYLVTSWEGKGPRNAGDEHVELRWFGADEIAGIPNLANEAYVRITRQVCAERLSDEQPGHG